MTDAPKPKRGNKSAIGKEYRDKTRTAKCSPELTRRIASQVARGAPVALATAASGASWNTVKEWMAPGNCEREPYKTFCAAIDKASALHAVGAAMRLTKAGKRGQWAADLAVLERRFPEFYRMKPAGAGGGGLEALEGLTPGQILDIALSGTGKKEGEP